MEIFNEHFFDWMILLAVLALAIYTMKIIGSEKSTFKEESYEVQFAQLKLMIPKWWSITAQSDHTMKFERTDTRYDWYANFEFVPGRLEKTLPEILEEKLNQEKIEFDSDVVFETDSRVVFRDSQVQEYFQEMIRVEGKAAQDVVDRIYYDLFILRDKEGLFFFESKSSVLNGSVEGPYFEESLAELSFISEA